MQLVVADLEATCWDEPRPRELMGIFEIGAVRRNIAHIAQLMQRVALP